MLLRDALPLRYRERRYALRCGRSRYTLYRLYRYGVRGYLTSDYRDRARNSWRMLVFAWSLMMTGFLILTASVPPVFRLLRSIAH